MLPLILGIVLTAVSCRMVSHWPCKRIFVLPALGWLHPARQWIERSHGWDLTAAPYALVFPMAVRNLNSHVVVL
jgi:hypothetical protein